ncbi:hypothetical protein Glove_283g19 [Diversispora epigaea]|uniref:P-type Cu(+) transporter n=1 Tax=Diversispora epigaea TaxID=1348612 RepID=A0A397I9K5_9GLOM|nr:hypothetical protein Glove_283g19 [Diversispora epigaea]
MCEKTFSENFSLESQIVKANLSLSGLSCASCVRSIEQVLKKIPGVLTHSIHINLLMSNASLEFDKSKVSIEQIETAINDSGYKVKDVNIEEEKSQSQNEVREENTESVISVKDCDTTSTTNQIENVTITMLSIEGISCASCINTIEQAIRPLTGVKHIHVNLLTSEATIKHDNHKIGPRDLTKALDELGYESQLIKNKFSNQDGNNIHERAEREQLKLKKRFLWSLLFAIPTFIISMIFMLILPKTNKIRMTFEYQIIPCLEVATLILFILSTPVQFLLGYPFYVKGIRSIWYSHQANMDTLVAVGTTVAYFGSLLNVIIPIVEKKDTAGQQFFETSVFLITFIWLGRWLESKAKGKTFETITKLMELQPEKATLITINDDHNVIEERDIDLGLVQVGDILKVNPGARIPCDGKIYRGTTTLDESMLTGESIPVTKYEGDEVITATVNLSSMILIKTTRVGSDTTLFRIIDLVQQAQSSKKAPIEALADKIAQIFVPTVILLAIIDFIVWISLGAAGKIPIDWLSENENYVVFSLFFAICVLVIACPCAMGLASPTAIMVGTGIAARYGILIKGGGEAIEMASRLSIIAFDKTGTLTYGKPHVVDTRILNEKPISEINNEEYNSYHELLWQIIGHVESSSDHPMAKAVTQYVNENISKKENNITMKSVIEIPGKGLKAIITIHDSVSQNLLPIKANNDNLSYNVFIGNERWLKENGCTYPFHVTKQHAKNSLQEWQNLGYSIVLVGLSIKSNNDNNDEQKESGYILVQLGISDIPRPDASKTVETLKSLGIEVWMITGDHPITAKVIGKKLGIENILAEVTPEMKAEKIKWLQRKGYIDNSNRHNFLKSFSRNRNTQRPIVGMVGDGINDSPALAQADLPISIANATDVAIETASIILTRSTLTSLIALIYLAKAIIWRIRLNFMWAYIYNTLSIPIAAGIFFPLFKYGLRPELASLAMVISSVSVILSSLHLKKFKEPKY